tara:strand:- start:153 stop:617 length:465 start_codon:yes stop_codon:yes gene_type:complete
MTSYTITLTNRISIGSDTDFRVLLADPIVIKKNSYIQIVSVYLEKANAPRITGGMFVSIPEFSTAQTYWCNQDGNSCRNGMIGMIGNFPNLTATGDDKYNNVISYPKISLNNQEMNLNSLTLQLRNRENKIIDPTTINNVAITIQISDDVNLLN